MMPSKMEATSKRAEPLVSPRTGSRNARLLVCGYFEGVERCRRELALAGIFHISWTARALDRAALRVDPAKSSDFEGVWLPLHASSRFVASRQPRVDSAHSFVRQTPIGRPRTRFVGKQPSNPLSARINQPPCSAHPYLWDARARGTSVSATPGTRGASAS